jgi:hypothetical protein
VSYSRIEIAEYARKIGRSRSTIWLWVKQGCDLRDAKSVAEWVTRNTIRETNISKARKRRRDNQQKAAADVAGSMQESVLPSGNGNIAGTPGRRGAAAALERLEATEEEAHRRLQAALSRGNAVEIQGAEEFWLRTAETLRRLDLAVETARREAESQVPLRVAQEAQTAAAEWMRIAVAQFLSSETNALMAFKDGGEFRAYFVTRFRGILELTVKNADQTNSPVPDWAKTRIKEAWNVQ